LKRILVMEFIHGLKISEIDGIKKMGLDIKDVGYKPFIFNIDSSLKLFKYFLFLNLPGWSKTYHSICRTNISHRFCACG